MDVLLQLGDRELLLPDRGLDEIPDRHNAAKVAAFHDEHVPGAPAGHQSHARIDADVGWGNGEGGGHDGADRRVVGRPASQNDLPRIVAFQHDAHRPTVWKAVSCHESQVTAYTKLKDASGAGHEAL